MWGKKLETNKRENTINSLKEETDRLNKGIKGEIDGIVERMKFGMGYHRIGYEQEKELNDFKIGIKQDVEDFKKIIKGIFNDDETNEEKEEKIEIGKNFFYKNILLIPKNHK